MRRLATGFAAVRSEQSDYSADAVAQHSPVNKRARVHDRARVQPSPEALLMGFLGVPGRERPVGPRNRAGRYPATGPLLARLDGP